MTNGNDWVQIIVSTGTMFSAIAAIVGAIVALAKIRSLKPILAAIVLLATIVVPNSVLVYVWMYAATANSNRLGEAQVFIALTLQLTLFVSVYTFCWGKWFYPKLSLWLHRQITSA